MHRSRYLLDISESEFFTAGGIFATLLFLDFWNSQAHGPRGKSSNSTIAFISNSYCAAGGTGRAILCGWKRPAIEEEEEERGREGETTMTTSQTDLTTGPTIQVWFNRSVDVFACFFAAHWT